jgi:cytochrome c biogenesis protein CcmG/thiol:disulfide interchange protein DsbE
MKSLLACSFIIVLMFSGAGCAGAQESPLMGKKAPDFTLERLSGQSASLNEVIKGKKAILFFFATWCPHCRSQLKEIAARKANFIQEGIEIVLVDIGEQKNKVAQFLTAHGIDNDAFLDVDSFVSETYEVAGVPTLVFIGADGRVRFVEYGLPDNYQEILN